jgi:hypothetical protein
VRTEQHPFGPRTALPQRNTQRSSSVDMQPSLIPDGRMAKQGNQDWLEQRANALVVARKCRSRAYHAIRPC